MEDWNNQLTNALMDTISDIHINVDDSYAKIYFLTDVNEGMAWNLNASIDYISGSHLWLKDIETFAEGFSALSGYDGVGGIFFDISYNIITNTLNIDEELDKIKILIEEFVLSFHNLVTIKNRPIVMRLRMNYIKLDSNNPEQDVLLGRFEWVHDSMSDDRLENVASFDLSNYFETAVIHDNSWLFEPVCFADHELIGTWANRYRPFRFYQFNKDGTGVGPSPSAAGTPMSIWQRAADRGREFVWRMSNDGYLIIIFCSEVIWTQENSHSFINDIYVFSSDSRTMPLAVNGNTVELKTPFGTERDIIETHVRVEWPSYLYGSWKFELDYSWITVIHADGTGNRGFPYDTQDFRWFVESETRQLRKVRDDSRTETWSYKLDGDSLILINWWYEGAGQQRGQEFRFISVE